MKLLLSFNNNNDQFYHRFIPLLIANIKLINQQNITPTLYADQETINTLQGLDVDFILTNTDNVNTEIFWAYNKLILLSKQTEPFIYIDYDLFIKDINTFINSLPKDKIIFSHLQMKSDPNVDERWEFAYDTIIDKIKEQLPNNEFFRKITSHGQYNASLIYAPTNDLAKKIKEVSDNIIKLIKELNVDEIPFNDRGNMCIFEQFPFYCYLKDYADTLYISNPDYTPTINQDLFHLTYMKYDDDFIETFVNKAKSSNLFL